MIIRIILILILCFFTLHNFSNILSMPAESISIEDIEVYFSPRGGAEVAIVQTIEKAKDDIKVMAYSFTAKPIADAIIKAHKRGVNVAVILDKSQQRARGGKMQDLVACGIAVYIDKVHAIAHNKIMIIDKIYVVTGSYNFSKAAEERNAENVLILKSKTLALRYLNNFYKHLQHSIIKTHLSK